MALLIGWKFLQAWLVVRVVVWLHGGAVGVPGAGGEAKMGNGRDLKEGRMLPASINFKRRPAPLNMLWQC